MKRILFNAYPAVLFFALLFASCRKADPNLMVPVDQGQLKSGAILPYIFDWENATWMPSSPANQIPMPWNSGTTAIDPIFASDYKKSDGWKLVWNTFSLTSPVQNSPTPLFFSLYNVYNGLLRFYLWQPATAIATSYVTHGLSLYPASPTSQLLNFSGQEISDPTVDNVSFSLMNSQPINASGGTWYVFQYETAYDPAIANTSFPGFGLHWSSQYASISKIVINGTETGTITGTIGAQSSSGSSSFNFAGALSKGIQTLAGGVSFLSTGTALTKSVSDALQKAGSGIVTDFISAILGISTQKPQSVSLTLNSNIALTGSLTTSGGLEDLKLALPGQSNSQTADGNVPAYDTLFGVFNLTDKPTVSLTSEPDYNYSVDFTPYINTYTLNPSSIHFIWNTKIINSSPTGATVQNIKYELLGRAKTAFAYGTIYAGDGFAYPGDGNLEEDGTTSNLVSASSYPAVSAPEISEEGGQPGSNLGLVGVRITFDVVPNSGTGTTYRIVKAFTARIQ